MGWSCGRSSIRVLQVKARAAVDFRGTGTALPRFAIPANGEIGSEVPLNVMERVEDNHAGRDGNAIVNGLPAIRIAAKTRRMASFMRVPLFSSAAWLLPTAEAVPSPKLSTW